MKKFLCAIVLAICLSCTSIPIYAGTSSGAGLPAVSIVSPSMDTVYTKDLLISLRVSEAKILKLRVERLSDQGNKIIRGPITYENNSSLNFYTTQIKDIEPGEYKIIVDEFDAADKVIATYESNKITVKEKQAASSNAIFSPPAQNNTLQVIQTIIKNIFGG